MRALIIYAHPNPDSFTAAIRDCVASGLAKAGAEYRLLDLYAEGFAPVLSLKELECYENCDENQIGIETHCDAIRWADTLIFVYPTWWYGVPAILKGWLDRVLVPGLAFKMPSCEGANIAPGLTHITGIAVYTTCGASWWLTRLIGAPGRRTLQRGVRLICAKRCRTSFAAHYCMDSSSPESRAAHLSRVSQRLARFVEACP